MEDLRQRSGSLTTFFASVKRRYSLDLNFLPSKQKFAELATSFSSLISETKSTVPTLLDVEKSTKHSSLNGIQNMMISDENGHIKQQQRHLQCNFEETEYDHVKEQRKGMGKTINDMRCLEINTRSEASAFSRRNNDSFATGSSITESSCLLKLEQRDSDASYQPSFGTNSKNKCIEWMSKIPEEATPTRTLRKSMSEFGIVTSSHRHSKTTLEKTSVCQNINGKKFVKANSVLRGRVAEQYCFYNYVEVKAHDVKTDIYSTPAKDPLQRVHGDIEQAICKVLNAIGDDKLAHLMQQKDETETNIDKACSEGNSNENISIIPECEQHFVNSPHPKRKFSLCAKGMSQLEKEYINIKTDMYTKSTKIQDAHVGEINISIQYLIVTERLKVTVNNVCSLQQSSKNIDKCNIFVNVSLVSNRKRNKDTRTKSFRSDKSTNFDQNIYFKDIKIENVHLLCLRFGVFKKSALFSKKHSRCVGECFIYLDNCDVVGKTQMSKELIACK